MRRRNSTLLSNRRLRRLPCLRRSPCTRLFAPMQLGGVPLRNRIVHASMSTRLGQPGGVSPAYLRYCETRARGGAAMLVTEPVRLLPEQGAARIPVYADEHIGELAR